MRRVCLVVLIFPFLLACGGSETVEPKNQAPSIEFTFADFAVDYRFSHDLTVAVSDPEGDPLSISWKITDGTLTVSPADNTIATWVPPATSGTDTVTVSVSDGEFTVTVTEELKRATLITVRNEMGSRTLTKAASPYIIKPTNNIVTPGIGPGNRYAFEAGVEVYISRDDANGEKGTPTIAVLGELVSNGTESDPVLIRPNDRTLRCADGRGWWGGFRIEPGGSATLDYTEISYGEYNIHLNLGDGTATLQHCRLLCSSLAGIKTASNGSLVVDACQITDNGNYGIAVESGTALPANVSITNSEIRFNGHTGIYLDLKDLEQTVPITISGNQIEFNAGNGIAMKHAVWPSIHNNDFTKNNRETLSDIRLMDPYPGDVLAPADWDTLLATHNYWGRVYESGQDAYIEQGIWDSKDIPEIGTRVIINPWENESQYTP